MWLRNSKTMCSTPAPPWRALCGPDIPWLTPVTDSSKMVHSSHTVSITQSASQGMSVCWGLCNTVHWLYLSLSVSGMIFTALWSRQQWDTSPRYQTHTYLAKVHLAVVVVGSIFYLYVGGERLGGDSWTWGIRGVWRSVCEVLLVHFPLYFWSTAKRVKLIVVQLIYQTFSLWEQFDWFLADD